MLVDSHTHLFFDEAFKNREVYFDDPSFKLLYESKSRIAHAQDLNRYLQDSSISHCIAYGFCWESASRCKMHNEYLLANQSVRVHPFASVPSLPDKKIFSILEEIRAQGFKGVGEVAFYTQQMDDAVFAYLETIFSYCEAHGLIVSMHLNDPVGHHYTGKYIQPFDKIYSLIQKHPLLDIILAHFGGGILFYEQMPEVKKTFARVFYDTAAAPYLYGEDIYQNALRLVGDNKLLFGTDYPLLGAERYIETVSAHTTYKEREKMFSLNTMKLLSRSSDKFQK